MGVSKQGQSHFVRHKVPRKGWEENGNQILLRYPLKHYKIRFFRYILCINIGKIHSMRLDDWFIVYVTVNLYNQVICILPEIFW